MSTQIREPHRDLGDVPTGDPWRSFRGQGWRDSIDTRRFIQDNYTPYKGDAGFLTGPTGRTKGIWARLTAMFPVERERGVYDVDAGTPSSITAHAPGYIDRDAELIVGLQTDAPLKRAIMPNGGWRVVETGLRTYGYEVDPRVKARTAQEAVQWLYFGYLAAVKEQNGAAMSLGRTSTFLDVYLQRDLDEARIDESGAQELVDDFVIKLRIVRFLRTPEYDALFSGDPTWVTEAIGGMGGDGRTLVTRTSFRMLQTLNNLGPAPEPNLTVLWSPRLPQGFKDFAARMSIETSSIQYESDELLRPVTGDDTAIACCVSAMPVGKQMQFFGARVNLAKTLLYAINGGRDEMSGIQVAPPSLPVTGEYLDYDDVRARLDAEMDWLARVYVDALNVIHYMHDKCADRRLNCATAKPTSAARSSRRALLSRWRHGGYDRCDRRGRQNALTAAA